MSDLLNEQLNKMRGLISILESETMSDVEGIDEGVFDNVRNAYQKGRSVVTGAGNLAAGAAKTVTGLGNNSSSAHNFRDGKDFSQGETLYNNFKTIILDLDTEIIKKESMMADLQNLKRKVSNQQNLDEKKKEHFIKKVDTIADVIKKINVLCNGIKNGVLSNEFSEYEELSDDDVKPKPEPKTDDNEYSNFEYVKPETGPTPNDQKPQEKKPQEKKPEGKRVTNWQDIPHEEVPNNKKTDKEYTDFEDIPRETAPQRSDKNLNAPNKRLNTPNKRLNPSKVTNPKRYNQKTNGAHLSDWLQKNHSMNESVLLNEAAADDRFKTLFNTITSTSEEMGKLVATKSGGKYDASAVGTILELVFETLLNNGQTAFVDDIKDINQGFARYRTAERSLDTVKNGIRQTKAAADKMKGMGGVPNKNLDPTNLNGQSSSKRGIPSANMDNRAEQLAEDYINAHLDMFENTPENIADIKAHILELQK